MSSILPPPPAVLDRDAPFAVYRAALVVSRRSAVSFNTKPFKHRALVWIGFKKVLLFPFCWDWWLARVSILGRMR